MAGFNAANIVEPLDYDFTAIKGLENVKGTIPEPTSLQVQTFLTASRKEADRNQRDLGITGDAEDMTKEQILAVLDKASPSRTQAAKKREAEIFSDLCSGTPTAGQLLELPHRIMIEFAKWVTKEVLDPEVSTGGGGAQVVNLRSSSAG